MADEIEKVLEQDEKESGSWAAGLARMRAAASEPSKEHLEWRATQQEAKEWREAALASDLKHREWIKELVVKQHAEGVSLLTDIRDLLKQLVAALPTR